MQHIKFRSIERFENIVENVNKRYFPKPTLIFEGTVKLHGTNIGICYNHRDGLWVQSRSQILSEHNDNAGSYKFVMERKEGFERAIIDIAHELKINLEEHSISLYGELCGKGIQSNVGISNIEKSIFLFSTKISHIDDPEESYYVDLAGSSKLMYDVYFQTIPNLYHLKLFKTFQIKVNFNGLNEDLLSSLDSHTNDVEKECPVAKLFGFENSLGEGIVWSCFHDNEWIVFKTKGEKHSMKIKKSFIQSEQQKLAESIAAQIVTVPRLDQMYSETFDVLNGGKGNIKRIGEFMKAVVKDVEKEEQLTFKESGLELKQVTKQISHIAKLYFFERLKVDALS